MSPPKQLFKPDYSVELIRIAQGDLHSARELWSQLQQGRAENVVFLAQQAAEKSLKAVLNHLRIPFPLVHELGVLVALVPDYLTPPGSFSLSGLNPYATVRRYEEPSAELASQEVEDCLAAVDKVCRWAQDIVVRGPN